MPGQIPDHPFLGDQMDPYAQYWVAADHRAAFDLTFWQKFVDVTCS